MTETKLMCVIPALLAALCAAAEPLPLYRGSVSFHLGFDGATEADISRGKPAPVRTVGTAGFRNGLRGKALFCGKDGGALFFLKKDNIRFSRSGTILFFYKPLAWEKDKYKGGVSFLGFPSGSGALHLNIAYDPVSLPPGRRPLAVLFLHGKRIPSQLYLLPAAKDKNTGETWHLFAFSWEPGRLQTSRDGRPWKEFPVGFTLADEDFPSPVFCVGNNVNWNYLLDEFTVYDRVLSCGEIAAVYKEAAGGLRPAR